MTDQTHAWPPRTRCQRALLCARALVAVVVILATGAALALPQVDARSSADVDRVLAMRHGATDFGSCQLQNADAGPEGLTLGTDLTFRSAAYGPNRRFGICVSEPVEAPVDFDTVSGTLAFRGAGAGTTLEARFSLDGSDWTPWQGLVENDEPVELEAPARFVQYRVTLLGADDEAASIVVAVALDLSAAGTTLHAFSLADNEDEEKPKKRDRDNDNVVLPETTEPPRSEWVDDGKSHPTVRVFATREGLVGLPTANGHVIREMDRFAALPSTMVLNAAGEHSYQVRVAYKGRSAVVPIWDIGPWNIRDNYWDARRDLFSNLPRYLPQALAAWRDGYNGGRDQYGRWVSFPASIDLADGTYWEDLQMGVADWVDVTFLWVEDDSPVQTPPMDVFFKPAPGEEDPGDMPRPLGTVWYFAEGSTKEPFDTWFLVQNPNDEPARLTLTLMKTDGETELREMTLAPTSRTSLYMNDMLAGTEFSTRLDASIPVYAERAMFFKRDGHVSTGISAPSKTWYLAEGSSQEPFDTWILLQNPGVDAASVDVTFMLENGGTKVVQMTVWPNSRLSLYANAEVENASFSTQIVSDHPLVVERAMYMRTTGGGTGAPGVPNPSRQWYFAEGNTRAGLDTWLLLQNPNDHPTTAKVTFFREDGAPVVASYTIGAKQRYSVYARNQLDDARFGIQVEAADAIVAERAMYFGDDGNGHKAAAHASIGSTILASTWFLAEGSTREPAYENILITNPGSGPAAVTLRFMQPGGTVVEQSAVVQPTSRLTVNVNAIVPDTEVSTEVIADAPVVVERSIYLSDMQGGTNTVGIPRP